MTDGPTPITVEAGWILQAQGPFQGDPVGVQVAEIKVDTGSGHGTFELVKNERFSLRPEVLDDAVRVEVKVILGCASADGAEAQEWHHAEVVERTKRAASKVVVLR